MEQKVTIYTLAEKLNMSVSAVSRAFNPNSKLSAEKRKIILEAAEQYGYVQNKMASRLSQQPIRIGVLMRGRIEAYYLAQMCQNLIVTVSPEKIILGGGVMQRESLFPLVRQETLRLLGGYVQSDRLLNHTDEYIVPPALFPVSGLWGSYLLGKKALENA